jgi:phosphatidylserine synthase
MVFLFSALMVSTIEYETMPKFDFSVKRNRIKVLVILGAAILLMIKTRLVMFPLVSLYILYGVYKLVFGLVQKTVLNGDDEPEVTIEKEKENE